MIWFVWIFIGMLIISIVTIPLDKSNDEYRKAFKDAFNENKRKEDEDD